MTRDLDATHFESDAGAEAPADPHVKPYVYEDASTRSLNFSMLELQSRMRLKEPDALDLAYTRTMMGFLLFCGAPASLAMIGLGGGSLAKFCHRHLPQTRITAVEINPHVIALRDRFLIPPDDHRFQVVQADGADFVAQASEPIDVLLVDGFDYDGQPEALCSQGFYDAAAAALAPQGLLVVNLHAGHADHGLYLKRIARSFDGATLEVALRDEANSVVFGFGAALAPARPASVMRRPAALAPPAWAALKPALARVAAAARERFGPAA
ncbi:MAG TPA: transferase [Ideonella sp.]|nr:transferase [Ideonella sp.]